MVLTHRLLIGLIALATLAGCSGLLGGQAPPALYTLRPTVTALPGSRSGDQVTVAVPDAPDALDTPRIVLSRDPLSLDYYADAAWSDRAPVMLQSLLVEALQATGRVRGVGRDTAGLHTDYVLVPELRDFEARYAAEDRPPEVVVRLTVHLEHMPDREMVGQLDVTETAQAGHNDIRSIVGAYNQAVGAILTRVAGWTVETAARK